MASTQMASAISQAALMLPNQGVPLKSRTKLQVAKRVFQLAASGGFPYTGQTYKDWARKWLTSDTYRLMEIDINAAASPHLPKNPERVAFRLLCSTDSIDPIVVDLNKQKTGKSHLGYLPKIVVLDGKHRKQGEMLKGQTRILAWVGCKAEKHLKNVKVIDHVDFRNVKAPLAGKGIIIEASHLHMPRSGHSLATDFNLYCATVPATGQAMLDQSGGEGGSRPRTAMVKADTKKCPHCGSTKFKLMPTDFETAKCSKCGRNFQAAGGGAGAGGMGGPGMSNQGGSGSNPLTMKAKGKIIDSCNACAGMNKSMGRLKTPGDRDPSDGVIPSSSDAGSRVEASDQLEWSFPDEQIVAPGAKGWEGYGPDSQIGFKSGGFGQSPGSGSGPRTKKSTGATRSEMSRLADGVPTIHAGKVKISKIWQAYKKAVAAGWRPKREMQSKAAPGWEGTVKKMKKHSDIDNPFALSWWMKQQGYTPGGKGAS
jgi:hypothetical protein